MVSGSESVCTTSCTHRPACQALEFDSRVPKKFWDGTRELPKVPDNLSKAHVPVTRLEQVSCEMVRAFIQERTGWPMPDDNHNAFG